MNNSGIRTEPAILGQVTLVKEILHLNYFFFFFNLAK